MEKTKEKKPKRGRPTKEKEKLTHSMHIRFSDEGYEKVSAKATKLGMSPTRYTREMALNGKVESRFTTEELDLIRKLTGIANNLNQIAKKANAAGYTKVKEDAEKIIEYLKNLCHDC